MGSSGSFASVIVAESLDVILAKVVAGLHFNEDKWLITRASNSVFCAFGNLQDFSWSVFAYNVIECECGASSENDPVL